MQKRIFLILLTFILIIGMINPIYADDEIEETSISQEEIDEILETAIDVSKIPTINSRNAVVYDRTSRKNPIW